MKPKDEAKEQAILATCLDLVHGQGIAGVKMSRVAQLAGLATGTVYIYYQGKKELLKAVYQEQTEKFANRLGQEEAENLPFRVTFRKLVERYFLYHVEEAKSLFFMEQYEHYDAEVSEGDRVVRKDPLTEVLKRGQAEMLIREEDQELLSAVVNGIVTSAARQFALSGQVPDASTAKLIAQIAWDAVKG